MLKLLKILFYLFFFLGAFVFFMPKLQLYYFAEHKLSEHKVLLSKELFEEKAFSLCIEDAQLYYDSIHSAEIAQADMSLFFFYNTIDLQDILLSGIAHSFVPPTLERVQVSYTIFNPLYLHIQVQGEFGEMQGHFHILEHSLKADIQPSEFMQKQYARTLQLLEKNEQGDYSYAKKF